MAFYADMAQVAADLLKPDSEGGLGQGKITIVRVTPGTPNPVEEWLPVAPVLTTEDVDQIGNIKAEYVDRGTIIVTDRAYMITPVKAFTVAPGDLVRIGGSDVGTVVHVEPFGSLDVPVYTKIYVNR